MSIDKQAQEEQARRLREQIEALKHPQKESASADAPKSPSKPKSLREAIQDRMRELDGKPHV